MPREIKFISDDAIKKKRKFRKRKVNEDLMKIFEEKHEVSDDQFMERLEDELFQAENVIDFENVDMTPIKDTLDGVKAEIGKVIVGQEEIVKQTMIALFADSHALLEGLPGLAKTLLVSTISYVLDLRFKRVQFTPDLMPSDISGSQILEEDPETGRKKFIFRPGPIFTNLMLADEINRSPPKVQASLLEAMQERNVTVGGTTHTLDKPFLTLATQNPVEQEGTYPLPEAQMDRFMFKIIVDYPTTKEEDTILDRIVSGKERKLEKVMTKDNILELQDVVKQVPVPENIRRYIVRLVDMTRPQHELSNDVVKKYVDYGAGPRALTNLLQAARVNALLRGSPVVNIYDVKNVTRPILRHRIALNYEAETDNISEEDIFQSLFKSAKKFES